MKTTLLMSALVFAIPAYAEPQSDTPGKVSINHHRHRHRKKLNKLGTVPTLQSYGISVVITWLT